MATEIQIRGVPEDLKRRVKERAARERLTVSQYLLRLIELDLAKKGMGMAEFGEWLRQQKPIELDEPAWKIIEAVRRGE